MEKGPGLSVLGPCSGCVRRARGSAEAFGPLWPRTTSASCPFVPLVARVGRAARGVLLAALGRGGRVAQSPHGTMGQAWRSSGAAGGRTRVPVSRSGWLYVCRSRIISNVVLRGQTASTSQPSSSVPAVATVDDVPVILMMSIRSPYEASGVNRHCLVRQREPAFGCRLWLQQVVTGVRCLPRHAPLAAAMTLVEAMSAPEEWVCGLTLCSCQRQHCTGCW